MYVSYNMYMAYTYIYIHYIYIYLSCLQLNFNSHHLQHQQKSRKTNSNVFGYLGYFWVSCVGEDVLRLAFGFARFFSLYISIQLCIHTYLHFGSCICICMCVAYMDSTTNCFNFYLWSPLSTASRNGCTKL